MQAPPAARRRRHGAGRLAYAADLPTPDEALARSLTTAHGRRRLPPAIARPAPASRSRAAPSAARARRRCVRTRRSAPSRSARRRPRAGARRRARPRWRRFEDVVALAERQARPSAQARAGTRRAAGALRGRARIEFALAEARRDSASDLTRKLQELDRAALDGGAVARAGRADRCKRRRKRAQAELETGVRADPLVKRCWSISPAPRSSACAYRAPQRADPPGRRPTTMSVTPDETSFEPDDGYDLDRRSSQCRFHGHDEAGAAAAGRRCRSMQAELERIEVEGRSGGGLVTVTLDGQRRHEGGARSTLAAQAGREGDPRGPHRRRA